MTTVSPARMPSAGVVGIEHRRAWSTMTFGRPVLPPLAIALTCVAMRGGQRRVGVRCVEQRLLVIDGRRAAASQHVEHRLQFERRQPVRQRRRRRAEHPAAERELEDGRAVRQRERDEVAFLYARLLQRMRTRAGAKRQLGAR